VDVFAWWKLRELCGGKLVLHDLWHDPPRAAPVVWPPKTSTENHATCPHTVQRRITPSNTESDFS
ncbi:MAG: hypothetical protein AAFR47_24550, partial [Pseudomonadota bacterium]